MRAARTLSDAERRRGLRVLLASTFISWGGFFLVVPLISVHYVDQLGWAAASVGLVLAIRQFTQQGVTALSGMLADRLGAKGLIAAGMLVRASGFATMARADSYSLLMLSAILAALGGALFESPKAAAIAALTTESDRPRYFALSGVVSGLGVTIGTQVGALLLRVDFAAVSLVGAGCFFLLFWLILLLLPPVRVAHETSSVGRGLRLALSDRPFVIFQTVMMGYWFMWSQFTISLPLAGRAIAGTANIVAWLYGVNSAVTVLFGYPLPRLASRRWPPATTLTVGVLLTALGLTAVAWAPTTIGLLLCVFVISLGTVLVRPNEQTVAAGLANPAALGSYFGAGSLSIAIGGGLGNYAGGALYDLGQQVDRPGLPWLLFGVVGLATAVGLRQTVVAARSPTTQSIPAGQ